MPRSDAIPLSQSSTAPAPQQAPTGRGGAVPLDQTPALTAPPAVAATAPPAAGPQTDAGLWGDPNSQSNALLNHLARAGNWINNAGRAIDDYNPLTFGFSDWARASLPSVAQYKATGDIIPSHGPLSYLKPPPTISQVVTREAGGGKPDYLDQLRAQTAGAHAALGPVVDTGLGIGTNLVGGMALPALASDATKTLLANSPRLAKFAGWGAGAATAGAQNAVESGLSTIGHGGSAEEALKSAEWGGGLGLALGALGVGSAKGSPAGDIRARSSILPSDQTIADLTARKTAAYAPNDSVLFDQSEVAPRLQAVRNAVPSNQEWRLAKSTRAKVEGLMDDPQHTATSIEDARDWLNKLASNPMASPEDRQFAPGFANALDDVLKTGISPTAPTGFAAAQRDAGDLANQQLQNAKMIQGWRDDAGLPRSGGSGKVAPAGALAELKDNPNFYSNPDVNQAMKGIARAGSSLPSSWLLHHGLMYPVMGGAAAAIGGTHGYMTGGQDPWAKALEEAGLFGGIVGGGAAAERGIANALARRAIARAAPTMTQGAPYAPTMPLRDAFQALLLSQGAKGTTGY